ncbi:MAG: hypothetical protein ABH836_03300 [Candidatus Omnitrophota bacterium]
MKTHKFLLTIFIITSGAMLYINQQTRVLSAGYELKNNRSARAHLLDCREKLLYNLAELKSPQNLHKQLVVRNIDMQWPGRNQVVKVVETKPAVAVIAQRNGRRFFGFTVGEAQAQNLK